MSGTNKEGSPKVQLRSYITSKLGEGRVYAMARTGIKNFLASRESRIGKHIKGVAGRGDILIFGTGGM